MKANRNTLLLIVAILISLVIWIQLRLVMVQTTNISLPIRYNNVTDSSSLPELPSRIRYRVSAKGLEILKLKFSGIYAQYDALYLNKENYQINPDKLKLELPMSINLLSLEPIMLNDAQEDKTIFKKVDARIVLIFVSNEVKDLFYKNNYKLSFDQVEVSGTISQLQNISSVKTEQITKNKLNKSNFQLKLTPPNQDLSVNPSFVEVKKMDQQQLTRIISHVIIKSDMQIEFYPQEVSIRIRGQQDYVNSLTPDNFKAFITVGDDKNGRFPIKLSLPDEIELIDLSPAFVNKVNE